ncbi:hypothetical protein ABVC46_13505 [Lactobacillus crispatus]
MIQELQQNYYAAFISTATDTSLDRVGSNMGVGGESCAAGVLPRSR